MIGTDLQKMQNKTIKEYNKEEDEKMMGLDSTNSGDESNDSNSSSTYDEEGGGNGSDELRKWRKTIN